MRYNLRPFYILFFLFSAVVFSAQEKKHHNDDRKKLTAADDAFDRLDFLRAFDLYQEIAAKDTGNYQAVYKMGICLLSINKTDTNCLKYLRKSKSRVPEAHFYLARVMHLEGHERAALDEYYRFKTLNKEKEIMNEELDHCIATAEIALKQETEKQTFVVKNLGAQINSSFPDYVPLVWSMNGDLVFTSRREASKGGMKDPYGRFYEDIYIAQRSGTDWNKPSPISDVINTEGHDACVAFSPDGKELLIYRTDEKQTGGDLYISTFNGTAWTAPVKLGPEINSEYLETSACFSSSGNDIIFASNRPGGSGGKDLYITRKFLNGKYSLPRNLGPEINSSEEEDAPFVDKADNRLYFSSRGHNSMGEYDIFSSPFDPDKETWGKPENLGMPINSSTDDIYFIKLDGGDHAMFTSRREGGYGDADIYQVNFNESTQTTLYLRFNIDKLTDKSEAKHLVLTMYDELDGRVLGVYRPHREYLSVVLVADIDKKYKMIIETEGCEPIIGHYTFTSADKEMTIELHDKLKTGSK
jgi:hypothetical protein